MRPLTVEETMLVSGGWGSSQDAYEQSWYSPNEGEIVVTGHSGGTYLFTLDGASNTWVSGDGSGSGNPEYAGAQAIAVIVGAILGFLGSIGANAYSHNSEAQSRVASTFHPEDKAYNNPVLVGDGTLRDGATMKDGSIFVDMNKDGSFDTHLMADPTGDVWRDSGDGWVKVVSHG